MSVSYSLVKDYKNLKLPFFFDSMKSPLNRFESFIYNFEFNLDKRSYILYFYFGSKERVKVLFSSFFFFLSLKKHTYAFYIKNLTYLFWNSLFSKNLKNFSNLENDYFYINTLYGQKHIYSDFFYYLNFNKSKFDRIYFDNVFDIDLSISTGYFDNFKMRFFKIVDDFNPLTSFFLTSFENSKFGLSSSYFYWVNKLTAYENFKIKFLLMFDSFNFINKNFNYISYLDSFINIQLEEYFLLTALNKGTVLNNFILNLFDCMDFFDNNNISFFSKKFKNFFKFFVYFFIDLDTKFTYFHENLKNLNFHLGSLFSNLFHYKNKLKLLKRRKGIALNKTFNFSLKRNYSLYYSNILSLPSRVVFNISKIKLSYFRLGLSTKTYPFYLNSKYFFVKSILKDEKNLRVKSILRKFNYFLKNFNMLVFSIYKKDFLQSFFSYKTFNFEIYLRNFIYSFKLFFINYKKVLKFIIKSYLKKYKKLIRSKKFHFFSDKFQNVNFTHFKPYKMPKELC